MLSEQGFDQEQASSSVACYLHLLLYQTPCYQLDYQRSMTNKQYVNKKHRHLWTKYLVRQITTHLPTGFCFGLLVTISTDGSIVGVPVA